LKESIAKTGKMPDNVNCSDTTDEDLEKLRADYRKSFAALKKIAVVDEEIARIDLETISRLEKDAQSICPAKNSQEVGTEAADDLKSGSAQ
jgi:hypothetical protein